MQSIWVWLYWGPFLYQNSYIGRFLPLALLELNVQVHLLLCSVCQDKELIVNQNWMVLRVGSSCSPHYCFLNTGLKEFRRSPGGKYLSHVSLQGQPHCVATAGALLATDSRTQNVWGKGHRPGTYGDSHAAELLLLAAVKYKTFVVFLRWIRPTSLWWKLEGGGGLSGRLAFMFVCSTFYAQTNKKEGVKSAASCTLWRLCLWLSLFFSSSFRVCTPAMRRSSSWKRWLVQSDCRSIHDEWWIIQEGETGAWRGEEGGGGGATKGDSSLHQKWTVAKDGRGSGSELLRHGIICLIFNLISTPSSCWGKPKVPECNTASTNKVCQFRVGGGRGDFSSVSSLRVIDRSQLPTSTSAESHWWNKPAERHKRHCAKYRRWLMEYQLFTQRKAGSVGFLLLWCEVKVYL